jgi:hypothetical protein
MNGDIAMCQRVQALELPLNALCAKLCVLQQGTPNRNWKNHPDPMFHFGIPH